MADVLVMKILSFCSFRRCGDDDEQTVNKTCVHICLSYFEMLPDVAFEMKTVLNRLNIT